MALECSHSLLYTADNKSRGNKLSAPPGKVLATAGSTASLEPLLPIFYGKGLFSGCESP